MFISAHIIAGLIIGKLTGNYALAIASAVLIDVDHLIPYVKHRVIFHPKKLWSIVTDPEDPYKNQRNVLHSFFTWGGISAIALLIDQRIGMVISLGYLSHLILDLLDGSDVTPFYPFGSSVKGPIGYLSKHEFVFTVIILIVYVVL